MRGEPGIDPIYCCEGKKRRETYDTARMTIKKSHTRKRRASGARIQIYRCRFCGGWHVGNNVERGSVRKGMSRGKDKSAAEES